MKQIFTNFFRSNAKLQDNNFPKLNSIFPYRAFDEVDNLYVNDGSYGFILEATPLCGADRDTVGVLSSMITDGVPEGCTIQVINWASPRIGDKLDEWAAPRIKNGSIYKKLAESRLKAYKESNWESLLSNNPFLVRQFRLVFAVSQPVKYGELGRRSLIALRDQLKSTLASAGVTSREMHPDAFLSFMDELVNPSFESNTSKIKWNKFDSLDKQLGNPETTLEVKPDELVFDGIKDGSPIVLRNYTVKNFPDVWAQWNNRDLLGDFYSDFLRIPCPFLTVFSFTFGREDSSVNRANAKSLNSARQANSGIAKFMPSILEKDRDWKFVVEKLKYGQKLVKSFYQVCLYAKQEEIEQSERYLKDLYKTKNWTLISEKYVQLQTWLAAMPFTHSCGLHADLNRLGRLKSMVTWSCANLAPLQGEWGGMNTPSLMLVGRRGQVFFWNPFENPGGNYNVAVIGKSGSGKSVFMQELVTSLRGAGGHVIVIDDGRSFMSSCKMQEGTFIDFGDTSICLNPFSIVNEKEFEDRPDYKDEVIHLLNLIVRQMCRATETTSDIENAIISDAIFEVWNAKKSNATMSDVANCLTQHDDKRAHDLGIMLTPYTKQGLYSRFFEGSANISLDNPYFVFEFDKIKSKPDLQRIVLMLIIFLVTEKMYHGDRKKTVSLIIDEAWGLLHGSHFAGFIEGIARRARKYNGQLVTGTQSVDDYYKNPAATAAIQNTDWFCILSQTKESIEAIKTSKRIMMDEEMEKALLSLRMVDHEYSEIMICSSSMGWSIGRLILDPYSIALYSSKGEDFGKIKALQEQGRTLADAIEIVAKDIARKK